MSTEKEWKYWCDTESPEEEDIPCGYQHTLDVFRYSVQHMYKAALSSIEMKKRLHT